MCDKIGEGIREKREEMKRDKEWQGRNIVVNIKCYGMSYTCICIFGCTSGCKPGWVSFII